VQLTVHFVVAVASKLLFERGVRVPEAEEHVLVQLAVDAPLDKVADKPNVLRSAVALLRSLLELVSQQRRRLGLGFARRGGSGSGGGGGGGTAVVVVIVVGRVEDGPRAVLELGNEWGPSRRHVLERAPCRCGQVSGGVCKERGGWRENNGGWREIARRMV
jgi:hypothetical protein